MIIQKLFKKLLKDKPRPFDASRFFAFLPFEVVSLEDVVRQGMFWKQHVLGQSFFNHIAKLKDSRAETSRFWKNKHGFLSFLKRLVIFLPFCPCVSLFQQTFS